MNSTTKIKTIMLGDSSLSIRFAIHYDPGHFFIGGGIIMGYKTCLAVVFLLLAAFVVSAGMYGFAVVFFGVF